MEINREKYKELIREYLTGYTPEYISFCKKKYENCKYLCGFGVGNMGSSAWKLADRMGRRLDFFCDNNRARVGG